MKIATHLVDGSAPSNGQAANGEHQSENGQPWGIEVHAHESFGPSFKKSWHVEVELHGQLPGQDIAEFQQQVRRALQACAQAVDDELMRGNAGLPRGAALEFNPAGGNGARTKGAAASEEAVDQLLSDLLTDDDDLPSRDGEAPDEDEAPAKKAGKKPASAPAKTKPEQAEAEDALPRVPIKYWVTLGVLAACFALYLLWPSGVRSPATLANAAMTARDSSDRVAAVAELALHQEDDVVTELRRVAAQTSDPDVRVKAFEVLALRRDVQSLPLVLNNLDHESPAVRLQALKSAMILTELSPELIDFRENDPADNRVEAAKNLRGILDKRKRDGEESLARMKARTAASR